MSESSSESPRKISRRGFLKAAAATGAAALIAKEAEQMVNPWIETPVGDYYPLYEIHTVGVAESRIPQNLNGLFKEGKYLSDTGEETSIFQASNAELYTFLPSKEKELLAAGVEFGFGDVAFPKFESGLPTDVDLIKGMAAIIAGQAVKPRSKDQKQPRREFIGKGLTAIGGFLMGRRMAEYGSLFSTAIDPQLQHPMQRIIMRMQALIDHTRVNSADLFYRNVMFSNQLLMMGADLNSKQRAKIGFNVGGIHSGVEDLLLLGQDFCRNLLVNIPSKELLQAIIDVNEGSENFSSTRLVFSSNGSLQDRKITDDILKDMVSQKLSK